MYGNFNFAWIIICHIRCNRQWKREKGKELSCLRYSVQRDNQHHPIFILLVHYRFSSSFYRTDTCAFIWDFAAKLYCRTTFYRQCYSILFNIFDFFELLDCNQENSAITYSIKGELLIIQNRKANLPSYFLSSTNFTVRSSV